MESVAGSPQVLLSPQSRVVHASLSKPAVELKHVCPLASRGVQVPVALVMKLQNIAGCPVPA